MVRLSKMKLAYANANCREKERQEMKYYDKLKTIASNAFRSQKGGDPMLM